MIEFPDVVVWVFLIAAGVFAVGALVVALVVDWGRPRKKGVRR